LRARLIRAASGPPSCSFAFAKVYTSKMPITACDLLHDRVLPFYEHLGITVGSVLTDNGREFCGKLTKPL
jgi:hypothetical protein